VDADVVKSKCTVIAAPKCVVHPSFCLLDGTSVNDKRNENGTSKVENRIIRRIVK
jgi:hypothetical protein